MFNKNISVFENITTFMSTEKNVKKNQKPTYEIKETPLLKKIFNKILGPIRFF